MICSEEDCEAKLQSNNTTGKCKPHRGKERAKERRAELTLLKTEWWNLKSIEERLVIVARARAKRKNLPFDLLASDLSVPEMCPYLGIRLEPGVGRTWDSSPTLDRIDPKGGYVKGNVQVISHKANRMKSNASQQELETFARAVLKEVADQ